MSEPFEEQDRMFIAFDSTNNQVNQVVYETVFHGTWTRLFGEWRALTLEDESLALLDEREIAQKHYQKTRDYFDDAIADKKITYEPEYRMWYA